MGKKTKYYAVAVGRKPGIYEDWSTCEQQVKKFTKAKFKSFSTRDEAEAFLNASNSSTAAKTNEDPAVTKQENAAVKEENENVAGDKKESAAVKKEDDADKKEIATDKKEGVAVKREIDTADVDEINNKKRKISETIDNSSHWLVRVHFDGGSRGNPGVAGAGALVVLLERTTTTATTVKRNNNKKRKVGPNNYKTQSLEERKKIQLRKYLGTTSTNNQAEYHGLLVGVQRARREILDLLSTEKSNINNNNQHEHLLRVDLEVRGDSELIIRQLEGEYKCRHPKLQPLFQQVNECVEELKRQEQLQLNVTYEHVYREDNSNADALANEAMDFQYSCETIFHNDGTMSNGPLTS